MARAHSTRRVRLCWQRPTGLRAVRATKDLLLVEFADFQCPHCKAVQPTVQKLLQEFPNAHFVFENLPLTSIHSEALKAALYSVCVAKLNGNDAFFKFSDLVFQSQEKLTPQTSDSALNDAATQAGADAAKVGGLRVDSGSEGNRRRFDQAGADAQRE